MGSVYSSGFQPGGHDSHGSSLPFFTGLRELLIKIFIISYTFHILYMETLFVVARTIGSPGKNDNLHFNSKLF